MNKCPHLSISDINPLFGIQGPSEALKNADQVRHLVEDVHRHPDNLALADRAGKHVQYTMSHTILSQWRLQAKFRPVREHDGSSVLPISGRQGVKVPVQTDLSMADNMYIAARAWEISLRQRFLKFATQKYSSQSPESVINQSVAMALSTGALYNYYAHQVMYDGYAHAPDTPSETQIAKRLKSAYQLLAQIAGKVEHLGLLILDEIATASLINPFALDVEADKVVLKPEVFEILQLAGKAYVALRSGKASVGPVQTFLTAAVEYTGAPDIIEPLLITLSTHAEIVDKRQHGCPALKVQMGAASLFRDFFDASMSSFEAHFQWLHRQHPGLAKNPTRINGRQGMNALDGPTAKALVKIAKLSQETLLA